MPKGYVTDSPAQGSYDNGATFTPTTIPIPDAVPAWVTGFTWPVYDQFGEIGGTFEAVPLLYVGKYPGTSWVYSIEADGKVWCRWDSAFSFKSFYGEIAPIVTLAMAAISAGLLAEVGEAMTAYATATEAGVTSMLDAVGNLVASEASAGAVTTANAASTASNTALSIDNAAGKIMQGLTDGGVNLSPAVSKAVGRVAVSTVMNGGDPVAAAKNYLAGLAGAGIGDVAASGFDSATIGAAVGAGATAAIKGGNVIQAVALGASNTYSKQNPTGAKMDDYVDSGETTIYDDGTTVVDTDWGSITTNPDGSVIQSDFATGIDYVTYADGSTYIVDHASGLIETLPQGDTTPAASPGASWFTGLPGAIAALTPTAISVLNAVTAYKKAGTPAARQAVPLRTANGSTVRQNPDGTVTTTTNGVARKSVMPVGQPVTFDNGSTVINNGDGTITTVYPDGHSTVTPIGATTASAAGSGAMAIGAVVAGLLFFKLRK